MLWVGRDLKDLVLIPCLEKDKGWLLIKASQPCHPSWQEWLWAPCQHRLLGLAPSPCMSPLSFPEGSFCAAKAVT